MADNTTLTVVTVCRNDRRGLETTMQSVLSHAEGIDEYIVIDGDSSDGTRDMLVSYAQKYPFLRWISEPDTGPYDAMNKGIRMARGDWVHLLNAGDVYEEFLPVRELIEETPETVDVIAAGIKYAQPDGSYAPWKPFCYSKLNWYEFPHPGLIVRRRCYTTVGLYDTKFKIISDGIWIIQNIPRVRYVLSDSIFVAMAHGGLSTTESPRLVYERFLLNVFFRKWPLRHRLAAAGREFRELASLLSRSLRSK
uniref:Glycosyltransferase involved in cell wall bisynthesis n=1 Tax=Candidatus Kentrum sp. DK TaxID=2126562 RepID=A0A450ST41_9GAMM|nr:MAG: Glycosyltransferase involved in cell wall bisynthesis [Candidatus Kentron sp. DK]